MSAAMTILGMDIGRRGLPDRRRRPNAELAAVKFHPLSELFPLMEGATFASLVADIEASGLREPIVLLDDAILDGRNRWRACEQAGVEPSFKPYLGDDPLAYVISLNLQRRHLDESQRAMVAAKLATMAQGRPREKSPIGDFFEQPKAPEVSQARAAEFLNVGKRSVERARIVQEKGAPELVSAVERGAIPVSVAAKLAGEDLETQRAAVAAPEKAAHIAKQKAREEREAELAAQLTSLPQAKFGVILADPEWRFQPYSRETGMDRAADNHYPTSDLDAIKARDVGTIAADDCALFLWATAPMLPQAIEVMRAWGFEYKSHFVWAKDRSGTGYWSRNKHELLLIGTRGSIPAPAMGTQAPSLIEAPVGRHSEKPDVFYEIIEGYFPSLPKIELNARRARPGWSAWGNEAPERPPQAQAAG